VASAVFDTAAAASQVVAALLPQADSERAGQAKQYLKSDRDFPRRQRSGRPSAGCPLSRPAGCRPYTAVVKDAVQRSFREDSDNPEGYLLVCLTYR
jgi:hypothetical protein